MINRYLNRLFALSVGLSFCCASCGDPDLFDTDRWSDKVEGLEPSMKLKIGHGSFTLGSLLTDSTGYLQQLPDSRNPQDSIWAIRYEQKDIYHLQNLSSIFDLSVENLSFQLPTFQIPAAPEGENILELTKDLVLDPQFLSAEVVFGKLPEGCSLKEVAVSTRLDISLPKADFNYELTVRFENMTVDGAPYSKVFLVEQKNDADAEIHTETIDLPWAVLDLSQSGEINVQASIVIRKGQTVLTGTEFSGGQAFLSNLDFIKAVGKIKTEPMVVNGSFDLNIDFLDKIGGDFQFADPEIKILTRNKGIGVAANLQMSFWVKDGIGANRFDGGRLVFPVNRDSVLKTGTMVYRGEQLAKFLSLPPVGQVSYEGRVTAAGSDASDDVIWKNGALDMDAEITIPLSLTGELAYKDTISDISISSDIANKIMSASIGLIAVNGMDVELSLDTLSLLDSDKQLLTKVLATKGKNKLAAAENRVPVKGELEFGLTPEQSKLLGRTKHILIDVRALSPVKNGVSQVATIYSNAKLDLNVVVKAQMNINDLDF